MRRPLLPTLVVAACLLLGVTVHAADPVGTWRADPASVKALAQEIGKRVLGSMSEEDKASMAESLEGLRSQLTQAKATGSSDVAELEAQIRSLESAAAGEVPPDTIDGLVEGLDVSIEVAADGTAVLRGGPDPDDVDHATWTATADGIEIKGDADSSEVRMTATIDGDRMELHETVPADDDGSGPDMMAGLTLLLTRQ